MVLIARELVLVSLAPLPPSSEALVDGKGTKGAVCVAVAGPEVDVVFVSLPPSAMANPCIVRWNRASDASG